jgi:hypothetical protein
MQQSRELPQKSLAAEPLRSPLLSRSLWLFLETGIRYCLRRKVSGPIGWYIDGCQFFADHDCGSAPGQRVANGSQPALEASITVALSEDF